MNDQTPNSSSIANIEIGVVILATTVSAVVWYRMLIWLWDVLAQEGWWDPAGNGARVLAAILGIAVTWLIWGRVDYWLHNTERQPDTVPGEGRGTQP